MPRIVVLFSITLRISAAILIPMDHAQNNHLKAYGIAYLALQNGVNVEWLLNYRGGAFSFPDLDKLEKECLLRGVSYEKVGSSSYAGIMAQIEENNMAVILLEKAPEIAVYTPPNTLPWDDAVTLALTYAEIPYAKVYDADILGSELEKYDWLHLHHEDFTGQYGKFYANYRNAPWYIQEQITQENLAKQLGYKKVSQLKLAVAQKIREYVLSGGFMFAMCAATDTYDIALAAAGTDICHAVFDHDPIDPDYREKLDYGLGFAFTDYNLYPDPQLYEFSDIDIPPGFAPLQLDPATDYFSLFEFSAKFDPIPAMLTQNHESLIRGFMGQTTYFNRKRIKKHVLIMGETRNSERVKYIHGNAGKGTFTYYGGHDPEDYRHYVGDPPTNLDLHKNSPGYRLILNNILFPAAKKQERKT
ncbi:MAG: asparagine synthetase B [Candidatus Neomarinimicrobiota bacterium]|nr:asparagine synthetase B [Candidatus Neomarinimicrobiota bacterium]MDX9780393.1 asparagine synthetase B [bacterium]